MPIPKTPGFIVQLHDGTLLVDAYSTVIMFASREDALVAIQDAYPAVRHHPRRSSRPATGPLAQAPPATGGPAAGGCIVTETGGTSTTRPAATRSPRGLACPSPGADNRRNQDSRPIP